MLRGPDAESGQFLADLAEITRRMDRAQRQISSGKRINNPSDDSDAISTLLAARSELASAEQVLANMHRIRTEADTSEQALANGVTALDRVLTLGTQGATDTMSPEGRATIAEELEQLIGQLVNLSNTQLEGRYVFAGDSDQVAPYSLDWTLPDPFSTYQGATSSRQAQHPSGNRFNLALTADQIFDHPDPNKNVFDSVNELRLALEANDGPAIRVALGKVRIAATHLNTQLSFYGTIQNQVAEATDFAHKEIVSHRTRISGIEDADLTAAIIELNESRLQQETALAAEARKPRTSLFDFLK